MYRSRRGGYRVVQSIPTVVQTKNTVRAVFPTRSVVLNASMTKPVLNDCPPFDPIVRGKQYANTSNTAGRRNCERS